jgi:ABC-2 type transport system permease protein
MFNSKLLLVAKREYITTVRKPSFWLSTIAFPLFILIIGVISGISSQIAETQGNAAIKEKEINIVDNSQLIDPTILPPNIKLVADNSVKAPETEVYEQKVYAVIRIPADVLNKGQITAYMQQDNFFASSSLQEFTKQLIQQSVIKKAGDPRLVQALNPQWQFKTTLIDSKGQASPDSLSRLAIPIGAVAIYMVLSMFATSYLLRSVSEEKENRMIEIVLSALTPRQLVWGKVLGQLGIVLTQLTTLGLLTLIALQAVKIALPAGILDGLQVSIGPLLLALYFLIAGFLSMAGLMVLAASAVPTYREAQSFSSVFVLISIFPIYFFTAILADPQGTLAIITSLLPLTSPLVMLLRIFLTEVPIVQLIAALALNLIYVVAMFVLAFKVFAMGAMEYNRTVSIKPYLTHVVRKLKFKH